MGGVEGGGGIGGWGRRPFTLGLLINAQYFYLRLFLGICLSMAPMHRGGAFKTFGQNKKYCGHTLKNEIGKKLRNWDFLSGVRGGFMESHGLEK